MSAASLLLLITFLGACGALSPSASASGAATPNASSTDGASPSASDTPQPTPGTTLYTVVSGDTLFSIAARFGATVPQLQDWNAERYPSLATDPTTLQAGWELIVAQQAGVTPLPSPSASPTQPPTTAGCHAGNRVSALPAGLYWSIPNAGPEMALTFDMGGRLEPALDILRLLIANHVCATIFPTGAMSQTTIGMQVMATIRAHPDLFEVGNHTMHHCDLVHGGLGSPTTAPCKTDGAPTADFIRKELTDAAAILRSATGQDPAPYWRPPYGTYSQAVLDVAASVGYTRTMLWDIDTVDWKPIADGGPTAGQISANVVGHAKSGSVVLMHLGGYETLDALKLMIPALRHKGLRLTSISDLFDAR